MEENRVPRENNRPATNYTYKPCTYVDEEISFTFPEITVKGF